MIIKITTTDASNTEDIKEKASLFYGSSPSVTASIIGREPPFSITSSQTSGPIHIGAEVKLSLEEAILLSDALKHQIKAYRKTRKERLPKVKKNP